MHSLKNKSLLKNNTSSFFRVTLFFVFLFIHPFAPSSSTERLPTPEEENRAEKRLKIEEEQWEHQQEQDELRRERELEREEREDKRREARSRRELELEARREAKEKRREMREQCEKAQDDIKEDMENKKDEREDLEQEFYDLEGKISDLEKQNSEEENTINEKLDELKKESQETVQNLKDEMQDEIYKKIEKEMQQLEKERSQLHKDIEKIKETRLTAFYARRKQQNEFYSRCFGQALEQTEKERSTFYQRRATGTLKRKNIGALISGGKSQTKHSFSSRFNSFLNLCLNNQAALLEKQNHKDEYELTLIKLQRQESAMKKQSETMRSQIKNLSTTGKTEIMGNFKQKMEAELNTFNQSYDSLTKSYQKNSSQIINEIKKIKQQQAHILMKRAQAVPQETRSTLVNNQCQMADMFNMFSSSSKGGILGSSTSSGGTQ